MFTEYKQTANWDIKTGSRPLHVSLSVDRDQRLGHSYLTFEVNGHMHPYLTQASHVQYFGDESQDPSLLPAAKYLQEEIKKIMEDVLREHHLYNKNLPADAPDKHAVNGGQGIGMSYTGAWLEKSSALSMLRPVFSDKQLAEIFEEVRQRAETLMPQAEELLKKHAFKAPKVNPTEDEMQAFRETIAFHTQRAMLSAERESKKNPDGGKYQAGAKLRPPRDQHVLN